MKKIYTLPELENMLTCQGEEENRLYSESKRIKNETIGNNVYLRGLIEISNICTKDCFYCGIRKSNTETARYALSDKEILDAADFAYTHHFGSIVLQGGERSDKAFVDRITRLLQEIKKNSNKRARRHPFAGRTNGRLLQALERCRSTSLFVAHRNIQSRIIRQDSPEQPAPFSRYPVEVLGKPATLRVSDRNRRDDRVALSNNHRPSK